MDSSTPERFLEFKMKTSKQAITAIKAMADRLDEIDGMYSWEQDAACVLDYINQQAARIAELESNQVTYCSRGGLTGVVLE